MRISTSSILSVSSSIHWLSRVISSRSIGVINAPQLEFSELSGLEKMLRAIPAEYVMLSDECLTAAKKLKSSADAEFLAAEDVMEISGITMACAKSGSEIPADIVLYYGYTRSEPEISGAAGKGR